MRATVLGFGVLLSACAVQRAPSAETAVLRADGVALSANQIDAEVARLMAAGRVPGLALALMQERVFDRFGMTRTSMTWRDDFRPNFARGFDRDGTNLRHPVRRTADAAGSMDTTITDWAAFIAGLQRGEGLSSAARSEMLSPQIAITSRYQFPTDSPEDTTENRDIGLSYGLGWGLFNSPHGRAFFKEGHDDGWNNYTLCLDEARRCIVIMANSSNGESIFLYLVNGLMGKTNLPWDWEGFLPYDRP